MNDKRILIDCLLRRKRIDFSPQEYFERLKRFLIAISTLAVIGSVYIIYHIGLTYTALFICLGILIAFLTIYNSLKKTKTASVKGDTLIMNNIKSQSCVTSIRSIRRVKTTSFLGIYRTELVFHLDGSRQKAVFYNLASTLPVTPETSIKRAIKISHLNREMAKAQIVHLEREKQKANHKPDPVLFT